MLNTLTRMPEKGTRPESREMALAAALRAALEARLAECQARQEDAMSAAQAEKLRALLYALVYKSAADYSVTGIVLEEAGAYFAGERSSAETAELVQDRISTYLSERYG